MQNVLTILVALVPMALAASEPTVDRSALLPELGNSPVTIVCLGDSVTGVYYHTGGRRAYPEMLEIALKQVHPAAEVKVINAGISGHTTQNGLARLDRDVLMHKPQLVTISFGLNDVARHPIDLFRKNLIELVKKCREAGCRVVLCTPNMVITTSGRPVNKVGEYCEVIRAVAKEQQIILCDQFAVGSELQKQDPWTWRLTLSDEIHPNIAGHKRMAEELCFTITGKRTSLENVPPPQPALAKTWAQLNARKPLKVLAMPPFDQQIVAAIQTQVANAQIDVTPWPTAGKTLSEIEQFAKSTVRSLKPNLVVIAVPREAESPTDESFVKSYSWIMNWSLSFGQQEWDCVVVHPAVLAPGVVHPRDGLVRKLVQAQHLPLLEPLDAANASLSSKLQNFLAKDAARATTPTSR